MNKTIRWGIIGCGDVTEVKSGPGFQKANGSALVAVMRRDAARAEDYAKRHTVPQWYADADALIADPAVDAIYVATPPSSHQDYVLKAAWAGKPVLVEKPMALTAAECETMISACRQAGVPLRVAYYRRKLPRFEKMRSLIQSGDIGEPRAVAVRQFMKQGRARRSHGR
jgi:predicted dehydrogenase